MLRSGVAYRVLALLSVAAVACGPPRQAEPQPELSFVQERQRWRATAVSAQVERLDDPAREEWSVQIVARRDPEGEQLTLFAVAPSVVGSHPVRAFGALLGFASRPTVPTPVTNVCSNGSLADPAGESASGTLQVEVHDVESGTLSGTFRVNVCDVGQPSDARTLAEGVFRDVRFAR